MMCHICDRPISYVPEDLYAKAAVPKDDWRRHNALCSTFSYAHVCTSLLRYDRTDPKCVSLCSLQFIAALLYNKKNPSNSLLVHSRERHCFCTWFVQIYHE